MRRLAAPADPRPLDLASASVDRGRRSASGRRGEANNSRLPVVGRKDGTRSPRGRCQPLARDAIHPVRRVGVSRRGVSGLVHPRRVPTRRRCRRGCSAGDHPPCGAARSSPAASGGHAPRRRPAPRRAQDAPVVDAATPRRARAAHTPPAPTSSRTSRSRGRRAAAARRHAGTRRRTPTTRSRRCAGPGPLRRVPAHRDQRPRRRRRRRARLLAG